MTTLICGIVGCDKQSVSFSHCCHEPLCSNHSIFYPICSQSRCENSIEILCQLCIEHTVYQCPLCKMTLCDECNTTQFWEINKCKCKS